MSLQPIQQPGNRKPVNKSLPRVHLTHSVIVKAPGLLPMLYLPSELAGELGMPVRTLYDWLNAGAPHTRDAQGNLWIEGRGLPAGSQRTESHARTAKSCKTTRRTACAASRP
jgi:hypothetical protein